MADLGSLLGAAGIGGAIGKAIVSLELDTKKYMAEMKGAQAQTVSSTNAMGASTSKFGSIASTALLSVGVAAVAGAALSVKAAIEANDAHLKLQNTFKNNASLSDSSVEAFEAQADALRDLTGVDDEAIISAQALLGQFDLTGQQVMELTPLIVDLSEKMDIDLQAAAKAVGKATQGSSGILSRYGIVLDETKFAADAYGTTLEGLNVVQGFAAKSAEAEPWRVLGAQFEEVQEQIGQALLPTLISFSKALIGIVEALKPMLDLIGKAGPVIELLGKAFTVFLSPLTAAIRGFGALSDAINLNDYATEEMVDLLGKAAEAQLAQNKMSEDGADALREQKEATDAVVQSMREQLDATLALADSTFGLISATRENRAAENELAAAHRRVNELQREGKENTKAYAEAKKELKDAALAAAESEAGLVGAVRRLQQEIASGKTSQQEAVEAIKDLGKAAGLTGKDIQGLVNDIKSGLTDAGATARRLAPGIGRAIGEGISSGIAATASGIAAQAEAAVLRAMAAARTAAQAKSPSKVMHELGVDMMVGLANGISDAEQKAIDAARRAIEKTIEGVSSELDKIKGKASAFRGTISGAFGEFLNIGGAFGSAEEGTSLSSVISTQVGGAEQLASVLQALKRQGASKGLLGQVAESGVGFGQALLQGGPEQIREANQALRTIAELSQQTGKALSEAFFGDKIDAVEKRLEGIREELKELNRLERIGHSHDIVMDGTKVAEATRNELIKTGKRNPGTGIN